MTTPSTADSERLHPAGARGALISTRQLEVGYRGRALLPPIDLEIARGSFWAVIGPNGAGKSTFVRTLLGLERAVRGDVMPSSDFSPSYVPQQAALDVIFPIRVLDFVLMGRLRRGGLAGPARRRDVEPARRALADVGAESLAGLLLRELSGGERQRVLIARALAAEANLCVFDEPTAALDIASERDVLDLISSLRADRGAAILMVTHLVDDGLARADRVLLLDSNQKIAAAGAVDEIRRSRAFEHLYGTRIPDNGAVT